MPNSSLVEEFREASGWAACRTITIIAWREILAGAIDREGTISPAGARGYGLGMREYGKTSQGQAVPRFPCCTTVRMGPCTAGRRVGYWPPVNLGIPSESKSALGSATASAGLLASLRGP